MRTINLSKTLILPCLISLYFLSACSDPVTTVTQVETSKPAQQSEERLRPNVLLIVADDLGFTDIGSFGSEIPTPNLDELAYQGMRLTSLHAAPACQESRSMLIGSVPASRGIITRPHLEFEGGERNNLLSLDWATIPELLQESGYATYITGKWDLGWDEDYTPSTRGFDRSFVQLGGASSFFAEPLLLVNKTGFAEDGESLKFEDFPEDFYVTNTYTEKMLGYLESSPKDQPWFAYMPYTAPHWPLQLPNDWLDRHQGNYKAGYDELRLSRFNQAKAKGVIQESVNLDGFKPNAIPWDELTEKEKAHYSRAQEIYAGMIEHLDMSIGRVIAYLRETNQLDNTLIIFTADHGASPAEFGAAQNRYPSGRGVQIPNWIDNSLENFGRKNSFIDHGIGFAQAATAPFAGSKGTFSEGGLRSAAFVYYPKQIQGGTISHSFMTMMDILPTIMQAVGSEYPKDTFKGRDIKDIRGVSAWPHLTGQSDIVHQNTSAGWAFNRGAALVKGDYKIMKNVPRARQSEIAWQLYNISKDPGERNDLAAERPELVAELEAEWISNWGYQQDN
ncbi:MAG: sulfatase-like hydrolase/transferase [Acidiferrobacterales bacterium]|nr:sulfatase-like hydrolase/transferase [Acidiferrobacterales bacterium]